MDTAPSKLLSGLETAPPPKKATGLLAGLPEKATQPPPPVTETAPAPKLVAVRTVRAPRALVPFPKDKLSPEASDYEQMSRIMLDPDDDFDKLFLDPSKSGQMPARPVGYWELRSSGYDNPTALKMAKTLPTFGTPQKNPESTGGPGDVDVPATAEREAVVPKIPAAESGFGAEMEKQIDRLPAATDPVVEERRRAMEEKQPELKVARAAADADLRKRADQIIKDRGLLGILGLPEDATAEQIRHATESANDSTFQAYLRYRRDKTNASLPPGQKLQDRPEDDPLRKAVDAKALADVATLRTVGLWGPKGIAPVERDPNSAWDALKPQAEVIGLDESGVPVTREQSGASYLGDVIQAPTYVATASGIPDAILRQVEGTAPGAKEIQTTSSILGLPVDPSALRERRTFSDVVADTDPQHLAERSGIAAAQLLGKTPEEQAAWGKAAQESRLGELLNTANTAQLTAAGALADVFFPDLLMVASKPFKLAKGAAQALGVTHDLESEVARAAKVAETAEKHRDVIGKLAADPAAKIEDVKKALTLADAEYDADKAMLKQTAQDAVEDAARIRMQAEQAAVDAEKATGKTAAPYNAALSGALDDAVVAEREAAMRSHAKAAQMALTEGLHRAVSLMEGKNGKPPKLSPQQVAAYAERLFDSAAKTARELEAGGRAALKPTPQEGAISSMVDAVEFSPRLGGSPEREGLEKAIDAVQAARRQLTGPALAKAEARLAPVLDKAVRKAAEAGIPARPAEMMAFRNNAIKAVQKQLIGPVTQTLPRATQLVDAAIRTSATPGRIDSRLLAAVDGILRTHATEVAEKARQAAPLRSAAPAILKGESASRFRALQANPSLWRTVTRGATETFKALFIGGNEMAPWAKEGLSAAAKAWTEGAVRQLEAVASDVGKIDSARGAADYLTGIPAPQGGGFITDGVDRLGLFLDHAKIEYDDVLAYAQAMLTPPIGRPEPNPARLGGVVVPQMMRVFDAARKGTIGAMEMIERMHKILDPFTVPGADLSMWPRITAGWIGSTAETISTLNRGFGDGAVLTKADVDAIEALATGQFDASVARALDPAYNVERAVAARAMIGPGATQTAEETIKGTKVPRGGVVPVRAGTGADNVFGLYSRIMDSEIYVPRMVRDRLVAATARGYTPSTAMSLAALSWWKLAVTRGALTSKPGYLVNNIPGDLEQVYLKFGINTALKTAIRSEGATVAALSHTGAAGRLVNLAIPGPAGAAAGAVAETGLGVIAATFVGRNKGWLAKIMHGTADVGEKGARAMANLLGAASFRLEVTKVLDGGDATIAIGDKVWSARELRTVAIRGGIWDSFDRAELVPHFAKLVKTFQMPAEGVQHLAETVSLRRRLGLYVTLIEDGATPEQAAKGVIDALFDFRAVASEGETHFLRQVLLPFWSWQKNMNRLVLGSITSPIGAYRIKQTIAIGRLGERMGDRWSQHPPTSEGDDVGVLTSFMPVTVTPAYDKFRRYREAVEKIEGPIKVEDWNALLLRSNSSIPVTMTWTEHDGVDKSLWLTRDEVAAIHPYVAPWYYPEQARSYLRDRTQFRMSHNEPVEGGMGEADSFWHVVAPPSGVEGSLTWFAHMALVMADVVAWPVKKMDLGGEAISTGALGEDVSNLVDPERAPILGSLIAGTQAGGRPPDRVAQGILKAPEQIADGLGRHLLGTGVGDGLWNDAAPGVVVSDKSGQVVYSVDPFTAAAINMTPGLSDLNRIMLSTEGPKGGAYTPDALRLILGSYGLSTPTVTTQDAMREGKEKRKWADAQLSGYKIDRDAEGNPVVP